MKFLLTVALTAFLHQGYSQELYPTFVSVTFANNKTFAGTLLAENDNIIKVQFYNSGAIYEFNRNGKIISSNGTYKAGDRASVIRLRKFESDVYVQGYVSRGRTVGVSFSDGIVYFGFIEDASSGWFSIRFLHSESLYTMECVAGVWKVRSSDKGKYPPGTSLTRLFYMSENRYWLE